MSQMADNVVVIGRGKLIADTSIGKLVTGASSSVFVRASDVPSLEKVLATAKLKYDKEGRGLAVSGSSTDEVGKLADQAKVTVLELTARTASLEEAFLELTEGSEEYQARTEEAEKS